jgi:hypothetical protein
LERAGLFLNAPDHGARAALRSAYITFAPPWKMEHQTTAFVTDLTRQNISNRLDQQRKRLRTVDVSNFSSSRWVTPLLDRSISITFGPSNQVRFAPRTTQERTLPYFA